MLIVVLAEDGPVVIAHQGVGPAPFAAPPGPLYLRYLGAPLSELALPEGQLPRGDGRPLPEGLATFEKVDTRWSPVDATDAELRLAAVRIAAPERGACLGAGGCYGLSPNPEECKLPCPCARTSLLKEPYPHNDCLLPDPRAEACYRSRGPLLGLAAPGANDTVTSVGVEDGRWILYFSTDRYGPPGDLKLARAVLEPNLAIRPGSIEPIDLGLPADYAQERPQVRADGLELFFQVRTGSIAINEIWVASRPRLGAPFVRPRVVLSKATDHLRFPVLLGDLRTLIFRSDTLAAVAVVRSSTVAGDTGFLGEGVGFPLTPGQGAFWLNLGCDRQSLIFLTTVPQPYALTIAAFSRFNPLELHSILEARRDDGTTFLPGDFEGIGFVETPDCRHLLLSLSHGTEVYDAVPCPR